jgi:hypothetical protein
VLSFVPHKPIEMTLQVAGYDAVGEKICVKRKDEVKRGINEGDYEYVE